MSGLKRWHKILDFNDLFVRSDSPEEPSGLSIAGVKRLCQNADTLLSRPGAAGERKKSGFRDIHAAKGSNRA